MAKPELGNSGRPRIRKGAARRYNLNRLLWALQSQIAKMQGRVYENALLRNWWFALDDRQIVSPFIKIAGRGTGD